MKIKSLINQPLLSIQKEWEPVIHEYFSRLNSGDFIKVSKLFSVQGSLFPPFEREICGREAIAQYLQSEAKGIQALPQSATVLRSDDGCSLCQVEGNVKTDFFTVNVGWSIQLNADNEIMSVKVKLLAELQDLLAIKHG